VFLDGNALWPVNQSVIIPITIVTTAIAAVIAVVPAPIMIVIAPVIAVVMPAMAVVIIKIRDTATEQYGGGHSQQHRCCALHSTHP